MSNTDHELRRLLVRFREDILIPSYPSTARDEGLLRRQMIDAILEHRPYNMAELVLLLPSALIQHTDARQLDECADEVGGIVEAFDKRSQTAMGRTP